MASSSNTVHLLMFAKYSVGAQRAAPAPARHSLCPKTILYSAGINRAFEPRALEPRSGTGSQPWVERSGTLGENHRGGSPEGARENTPHDSDDGAGVRRKNTMNFGKHPGAEIVK